MRKVWHLAAFLSSCTLSAALTFVLASGSAKALGGSSADDHPYHGSSEDDPMCEAIPEQDLGAKSGVTLRQSCQFFYHERNDAINNVRVVLDSAARADFGKRDPAEYWNKVEAFQPGVERALASFQEHCEKAYSGNEYPKKLAAAMERERKALEYAMQAYATLAWISATMANDVNGLDRCLNELGKKFDTMKTEDFMPVDKTLYDCMAWRTYPSIKVHVKEFNQVTNALIVIATMSRTLGNWKDGYAQIIEDSEWDNRKDAYHLEPVTDHMALLADLYSGEDDLNLWATAYTETEDVREQLEEEYEEKWEKLKTEYDRYFPDEKNLFAWFRSHSPKVDVWLEDDPYAEVQTLQKEIKERME